MEYLLISLATLFIAYLFFYKVNKLNDSMPTLSYVSQSKLFIKPIKKEKKHKLFTQSLKFMETMFAKIIFVDNQAYWIRDNAIYTAKSKNNKIDENTIQKVDIMTMNKVELDKMIFIVDKLTEGNEDDSRNSGK